MKQLVINMDDYRSSGQFLFSGKDRGIAVRDALQLKKVEKENDKIIIEVPQDVYSISSSFFLGLFGLSVRAFGNRKNFLHHYEFHAPDIVMKKISQGIEIALNDSSVL